MNVSDPRASAPADLAPGSGPPHDPGMEARMTALEASFGDVRAVLARLEPTLARVDERTRKIEVDLAELKGRVSQLPSTIQMIGFVLAVLALAGLSKYLAS